MTMPAMTDEDLRIKVLWGRWENSVDLQQLCLFRHNADPSTARPLAMVLVSSHLDDVAKDRCVRELLQLFSSGNAISLMAENYNDILCLPPNDPRLPPHVPATPGEALARLAEVAGVGPDDLAVLRDKLKPGMTPYAGVRDRTRRRRASPEDAPRRGRRE